MSDLPDHSSLPLTAGLTPAWGRYPWVPSSRGTRPSAFPGGTVPLFLLKTLACMLPPRPPWLPRPSVLQSLSLHFVLDFLLSAHEPQKSSYVGASWHVSHLVFAASKVPSTEPSHLVESRAPREEDWNRWKAYCQRFCFGDWTLGVTPMLIITKICGMLVLCMDNLKYFTWSDSLNLHASPRIQA